MLIRNTLLLTAAAIGTLQASYAEAQDAAAPQASDATTESGIGEIVVTAQKRSTSLQDTPIAITAFGAEAIARDQIDDFRDIAIRTPGLIFASTDGFSQITLRGVGLDITSLGGETAVATYQDGVYLGQSFSLSTPAFDLERIEVLRGPQGTLWGRNATGGAVNLVTKAPDFEPSANMALTLSNYDRYKVELGATGGLSDAVAIRGSLTHDDRNDGYRKNIAVGGTERGAETTAGRLAVLLKPSEQFRVTLRGDFQRFRTGNGVFENIGFAPNQIGITPANVGGILTIPDPALGGVSLADVFGLSFPVATTGNVPSNPQDLQLTTNGGNLTKTRTGGVSATIEWDAGGVDVKSITAYRDARWSRISDQDATNIDLLNLRGHQSATAFSQELNFSGTALNERANWFVGAYYFDENADAATLFELPALQTTFEALLGLPSGAPLPPGSLAAAGIDPTGRRWGATSGQGVPIPFVDLVMAQKSRSLALFGEGKYNLSDAFALTAGLRWTQDEKKVRRSGYSNILAPANLCIDARAEDKWDEVTGNVIAEYKTSGGSLVYGKVSRGYKSGGFNIGECAGKFDPEVIWAYEAGVKLRGLDGQLQLNTATFYYDYSNIQIIRFVNNASRVENAAKAKIFGIESEFIVAPYAIDGLTLSGSIGYLDTEYQDATFQDPIGGGPLVDVSGNDLIRSPKWKFSVSGEYGFDTPSAGRFILHAGTNYTSSYNFDVFAASLPNQEAMRQESYFITNLRASWLPAFADGNVEVQAFVENLFNEIYAEARLAVGTTGAIVGQFSAPRTYGVRVSARF